MSRPRKPGQPHKGWKKANKRLKKLASRTRPSAGGLNMTKKQNRTVMLVDSQTWKELLHIIGRAVLPKGTPAIDPTRRPPPTCQPQPERPPATGGEARSSGITGVAHDDTDERTRDS